MRALIADDEEPARRALRRLLSAYPDLEIAGEASNGSEAIESIEETSPDVLFLDIEMPGLNGFDVLAEARSAPPVVFVTAYDQYAVRAFETNALDYLLKPVDPAALDRAVRRVRTRVAPPPLARELLQQLRATLYPAAPAKLSGRRGRKVVLVPRRDILYVQSEDRLVFLCTASERFLTDRSMAELEAILPATEYLRIHRGTLVQIEAVQEMYPWLGSGAWRVRLTNGVELDVSRDRVKALRAAY